MLLSATVLAQKLPPAADSRAEKIAAQYQQMCEQGLQEKQKQAATNGQPNATALDAFTAHVPPESFCGCIGNAIRAQVTPQMLNTNSRDQIQAIIAKDGERCAAEASKTVIPSICPTWIDEVLQPPMPAGVSASQKTEACSCIQARYSAIPLDRLISLGKKAELGDDLAGEPDSLPSLRAECLRKLGVIH